jgi:4-amino-4-deoxy-L-arabinose transferase-like glycosyltransferase
MNSSLLHDGPVEADSAPSWTRRELVSLVLFLVGVLLFRVYNLQSYDVISADGSSYGPIGRGFFATGSFKNFGITSGPSYSFFVGLFDLLLDDIELSLRLVSVVFSTLTVAVTYLLGRSLFGKSAAWAAGLLCATLPFLHVMSGFDIIEPTFTFFLLAGVLLFWSGYLPLNSMVVAAGGFLLGGAYLCRSEGFIIWFALAVFCAIDSFLRFKKDGMQILSRVLLPFIFGFMLLFLPYLNYLHTETGKWQLSGKTGLNVQAIREYQGKTGPDQKFQLDAQGQFDGGKGESLGRMLREEPDLFWGNLKQNFKKMPSAFMDAMPWYLLLVTLAALMCSPWSRRHLLARALMVSICSPMVIYLLFFVQSRGFYPYVAAMCVWAGGGVTLLERFLPTGWRRWSPALLMTFTLTAYYVYVDVPRPKPPYVYTQDGGRRGDKHIGQRLKSILPRDAFIMTRSGRIAFYSERSFVIPPQEPFEVIMTFAAKNRVTHLIVTDQLINMRPQLEILFTPVVNPGASFVPPPGLKLVYSGQEQGGLPYLVYKLVMTTSPEIK